jgi:hypothetical protein
MARIQGAERHRRAVKWGLQDTRSEPRYGAPPASSPRYDKGHVALRGGAVSGRLPFPGWYKALTASLLPPCLPAAFAPPYGKAERDDVEEAMRWARRIYPLLPSRLRYVGPYQEAEQRLAGRTQPDLVARMCNRSGWVSPPSGGGQHGVCADSKAFCATPKTSEAGSGHEGHPGRLGGAREQGTLPTNP